MGDEDEMLDNFIDDIIPSDDMDVMDVTVERDSLQSQQKILKDYQKLKENYKTSPYLSKFEKTRILSERAQQITNGAPIFVEGNFTDTYSIAVKELEERKIPFIIRRPYGNTYEYWKIKDLR